MTIRFTASRLLAAAVLGAALVSPTITASPAVAAPCPGGAIPDPITGLCWSQSKGVTISGTGGTCMPGRLGLCLGALQNSQIPGANLSPKPPAGSAPAPGSWP